LLLSDISPLCILLLVTQIVFDKTRHPRTLHTLTQLLPSFHVGYGDKELYWFAATIARETFAFEPFLCGTYGDCGLMMHYDPNDTERPEEASPLYLNAEWYLMKSRILGKVPSHPIPSHPH
jgi:hypothetical protein